MFLDNCSELFNLILLLFEHMLLEFLVDFDFLKLFFYRNKLFILLNQLDVHFLGSFLFAIHLFYKVFYSLLLLELRLLSLSEGL